MRSVLVQRPTVEVAVRRAAGWHGRVNVWLPVVLAVIMIMIESTKTLSAANTSSWLRPIFERYLGHINDAVWGMAHHVMRKLGHFCGYGVVCVTFLRAWLLTLARRGELTTRRWRAQASGLAVLCTAVVASLDELHQSFMPCRTGQVSDVAIDTCGAIVMAGMVWLVAAVVRRRTRDEALMVA